MNNEATEKVLDKIKKCLALAKSSNANEAQIALRQARKLMDQHKLESVDVQASMADETRLKVSKRPTVWATRLGFTCAEAFGCSLIVSQGIYTSEFCFIGVDSSAQLSSYAYEVLVRQLQAARKTYVESLKRCKLSTKRRRGDIFANSWVNSVYSQIADFAGTDEDAITAIESYKAKKYPNLINKPMKTRKVLSRDNNAAYAGYKAGRDAKLHRSMGADSRLALTQGVN